MRKSNHPALILLCSLLLGSIGCHTGSTNQPGHAAPQTSDVNAIGERIADLLSTKCSDGYHFEWSPGAPGVPEREVRMDSFLNGVPDDEDKFLGYQWKGQFTSGHVGAVWFRNYDVFEKNNVWYLQGSKTEMPTRLDDLVSVAPACK